MAKCSAVGYALHRKNSLPFRGKVLRPLFDITARQRTPVLILIVRQIRIDLRLTVEGVQIRHVAVLVARTIIYRFSSISPSVHH